MMALEPSTASMREILARARGLDVWIIGDVMLDEYVSGDVERISPEAPVPVVRVGGFESRLGGAANVARQVAALGARASLAGIIGDDAAGDTIARQCTEATIDIRALRRNPGCRTTRKQRVLANNQQMLRLDWEASAACDQSVTHWMLDRLLESRVPDIAVLSDYAKGVLNAASLPQIIAHLRARNVRVLVDPKQRDLSVYRGANIITPNLAELGVAVGRRLHAEDAEAIAAAAESVAVSLELDAVVVTCGDRGMILVSPGQVPRIVLAQERALHDSTGAGDTAVATLATCLAASAGLEAAATIANAAAGVSVGRVGTTAVQPGEIGDALTGLTSAKVFSIDDIVPLVDQWRRRRQRIVFANGCFDLFHAGHLSLLEKAARCGDRLVVAINSDASVRRLKGDGRPLIADRERAALVSALACVDAVVIFDDDTPLAAITAIRPDVLVKGRDYRIDQVVGRELVESGGGRVELVPLAPERSTSSLIDQIARRWRTA